LVNVLTALTAKNSQIIISTHTPLFVTGRYFENVRVVRRRPGKHDACVSQVDVAELTKTLNAAYGGAADEPNAVIAKIHQLLQPSLNEMFFTPVVVLVEGIEDVAYITTHLELTNRFNDFRRLGCHLVPTNKKDQMARPAAVARQLRIPCFVVFDADSDAPPKWIGFQKRDNTAILHVTAHDGEDPLPKASMWKDDLTIWSTNMSDVVESEIGKKEWGTICEAVKAKYRLHASGDLSKNGILIGYALGVAFEDGHRSPSLERLTNAILKFASKATGKPETLAAAAASPVSSTLVAH